MTDRPDGAEFTLIGGRAMLDAGGARSVDFCDQKVRVEIGSGVLVSIAIIVIGGGSSSITSCRISRSRKWSGRGA